MPVGAERRVASVSVRQLVILVLLSARVCAARRLAVRSARCVNSWCVPVVVLLGPEASWRFGKALRGNVLSAGSVLEEAVVAVFSGVSGLARSAVFAGSSARLCRCV